MTISIPLCSHPYVFATLSSVVTYHVCPLFPASTIMHHTDAHRTKTSFVHAQSFLPWAWVHMH